MGPGREQPVVPGQPCVPRELVQQREPGRGSSTIATATARLSVIIGFGPVRSRSS